MDSRVTCTYCFPVDSSIPYGFILTFFPDFLKKNLLYSCAFESLNHYRHVIIYSAAGKNTMLFQFNLHVSSS